MKKFTKEVQIKFFNIEKKRIELSRFLEGGFITEEEIVSLTKQSANYGVRTSDIGKNPKKAMLKNIFNCPFLLCDQKKLSNDIKQLLPYMLQARYNTELDNLKVYLEQGFIDENEYNDTVDELKFFYYESTNDGKSILENGHAILEKQQAKAL